MARLLLYSPTSRLEPGGVQSVVERLARSARARGHEVVEGWAGAGPRSGEDEWILPLEVTTGPSRLPALAALPRASRSLLRLAVGLARRRPDLVNVHFVTGHALYFLALRRVFGHRVVLSIHGSDVLRPTEACRRYLPRFVREADAVTVVSEHLGELVRALPGADPRKVHVVPNGIDHAFWSAGGGRRGAGPPTIVAAGRMEAVKGFDLLLRAFPSVVARVPSARLVLAGEGERRRELEEQARRAGLGGSVEFPGHLEPSGVRELLGAASVFALPSRSEGMPLALIEALACGVPAVATRVGGVPEVLAPGTGLLVEPEDPGALADALVRVLRDEDLARRLRAAGRERSRAFSSEASDEAFEELYAGLLHGPARAELLEPART